MGHTLKSRIVGRVQNMAPNHFNKPHTNFGVLLSMHAASYVSGHRYL